MKKITNVLLTIFGVGVLLCLLAGALCFVGYIVAMFIGGETATEMCAFILKKYMPWVIKATSVFAGIGLIAMYLGKQKALSSGSKKEN